MILKTIWRAVHDATESYGSVNLYQTLRSNGWLEGLRFDSWIGRLMQTEAFHPLPRILQTNGRILL